ncbi:MAG: calcium-binding protein [Ilumatobacteraceae bacterium]
MNPSKDNQRRRTAGKERGRTGRLFVGAATMMGAGTMSVTALSAGAVAAAGPVPFASAGGTSAVFTLGVLTVVGDAQDNSIVISRDAAGNILVNGGAIPIRGGRPTVVNTRAISVVGEAGNDTISLDEANGALPRAVLVGGAGDDTITGGSGDDTLIGEAGNDRLLGKGGVDALFGGAGNDTLTGGTGDDRAFGEAGDDRLIWNPGEGTDLNEGGDGVDTTEVNGGNGAEQFTATANGTRVRFDRITPAPFSIDIGTVENLTLNANGGNDSFSASGNLAPLIRITVDGGAGDDTISGSNGADTLLGGSGNDFIDGQQGNDVALLGSEDDTFQWDPGDGSDVVEGQDGVDTMLFNGSNANENFDVSANGQRVRFFRNVGNITMDTNGVEKLDLNALGGTDNLVVHDLTGTGLSDIATDLAQAPGTDVGDNQSDNVTVEGSAGDDVGVVAGQGSDLQVAGLATTVTVTGADPALDRLTVSALDGDDVVDASGVAARSMALTIIGGTGNDVLIGGDGDDTIIGGDGDDVLIGGPGIDSLDGGPGDDELIDGEILTDGAVAGHDWLAAHSHVVANKTVLDVNNKAYTVPSADLGAEAPDNPVA